MNGLKIMEQRQISQDRIQLDVKDLPIGSYILVLQMGESLFSQLIIKE